MIRYTIPLKGLKVSTNKIYGGIHWTERKSIKDSIHGYAVAFCRPVKIVQSYPVEISYKFTFATRSLDTLNTAFMAKCFEDSFRSIGILKDDSPKYVTKTILEVVELNRKGGPKTSNSSGPKADAQNEDSLEIIINSI